MFVLPNNKGINWPVPQKTAKAFNYITDYWPTITRFHPDTSETLFGLPNSYVVPADQFGNFRFDEQYYWDSYFIALGLIATGYNQLAEGMLDNLLYMYKHFKMIPNASRLYMTSRSQPPILTTYILLIFKANNKSTSWLERVTEIAQDEYLHVWLSELHPHWHQVYNGLSRYYDINVLHDLAETESGWDMTPRFSRKALDYLPIDLNSLLYKYETDFAYIYGLLGDIRAQSMWNERAETRKQAVNELMWHKTKHFYFDYDFVNQCRGSVWSLAAYYTMWVGLASDEQAEQLVKHLNRFDCDGGLSATNKSLFDMSIFGSLNTQWSYPNGWAPLQLIAIESLNRYGYADKAAIIAKKWLNTNVDWFINNNQFLEKYNVAEPDKMPQSGVYPTQIGFGWTNAVFAYLVRMYDLV